MHIYIIYNIIYMCVCVYTTGVKRVRKYQKSINFIIQLKVKSCDVSLVTTTQSRDIFPHS